MTPIKSEANDYLEWMETWFWPRTPSPAKPKATIASKSRLRQVTLQSERRPLSIVTPVARPGTPGRVRQSRSGACRFRVGTSFVTTGPVPAGCTPQRSPSDSVRTCEEPMLDGSRVAVGARGTARLVRHQEPVQHLHPAFPLYRRRHPTRQLATRKAKQRS
jgi:hypothetical protein